jgi:HAD superfamily hydrolase (TIGR01450 family)
MKHKLLIDLDGTILNSSGPINKSREFFKSIESEDIDFLIMTNSVKSPMDIKKRLSEAGIEIPLLSIINPIIAINSYLRIKNISRVFVVGSEQESIQVRAEHDRFDPEIVLFLDFEKENYSFSDLQVIFSLLQKGIPAISASGSPYYISGEQRILDTGAFVKLFESAHGGRIDIFGKPSEHYYKEAMNILDCYSEEILVIGDDWRTDAQGAIKAGFDAVLVKTGKYENGDEAKLSGIKVIDSLLDILDW